MTHSSGIQNHLRLSVFGKLIPPFLQKQEVALHSGRQLFSSRVQRLATETFHFLRVHVTGGGSPDRKTRDVQKYDNFNLVGITRFMQGPPD